jgi:hypothetical protein
MHLHASIGDTSQKGNWYNFRNERFNSVTYNEMVIDDRFLSNIPSEGFLEFDYVSTCVRLICKIEYVLFISYKNFAVAMLCVSWNSVVLSKWPY